MTGATHMVVAAAIYRHGKFKTPALLSLAFCSHFLLDAVPHYELSLAWNYALGLAAGIALALTSVREGDYRVLAAAFLGLLPDTNWLLGISPALTEIHRFFHFDKVHVTVPAFFLLAELAAAAFCLFYRGESGPCLRELK